MMEEATDMFSELENVENFHCDCGFVELTNISSNVSAVAVSPEPGWHETGLEQNEISGYGWNCIEDNGKGPFDESITAFRSGFGCGVTLIAEVMEIAFFFEVAMEYGLQID